MQTLEIRIRRDTLSFSILGRSHICYLKYLTDRKRWVRVPPAAALSSSNFSFFSEEPKAAEDEAKPAEPEPEPEKAPEVDKAALKDQFEAFAKFGDKTADGKTIKLSQSDKWFKQATVIDGKAMTTTDTGIAFRKISK